jgi:hypothetical protein
MTYTEFLSKSPSCKVDEWEGDLRIRDKVSFNCKIHGKFSQSLSGHIKSGCPFCAKERAKTKLSEKIRAKWSSGDYGEVSKKISEKWSEKGYRESVSGSLRKSFTESRREELSSLQMQRWENPEFREKVVSGWKKSCSRETLSMASKKKYAENQGIREKISRGSKKSWETGRAQRSLAIKVAHNTESSKLKKSETTKSLWLSESYRDKVCRAVSIATNDPDVKLRTRESLLKAVKSDSWREKQAKKRISPVSSLNKKVYENSSWRRPCLYSHDA